MAFIVAPVTMTTWANASIWCVLTILGLLTDAVVVPLGQLSPTAQTVANSVGDIVHRFLNGYWSLVDNGLSFAEKAAQAVPQTPPPTGYWSSKIHNFTTAMSRVKTQMSQGAAFVGWMIRLLFEGSLLVAEAWWATNTICGTFRRVVLFGLFGVRRGSFKQTLFEHSKSLRWLREWYIWARFGDKQEYETYLQQKK